MHTPVGEQAGHRVFAHRIIALSDPLVQIEKANSLGFRNLPRPIGVAIRKPALGVELKEDPNFPR
jgi:hypothetical protein